MLYNYIRTCTFDTILYFLHENLYILRTILYLSHKILYFLQIKKTSDRLTHQSFEKHIILRRIYTVADDEAPWRFPLRFWGIKMYFPLLMFFLPGPSDLRFFATAWSSATGRFSSPAS